MFSSSMGQYGENLPLREGGARVMDFCDVDSDKWQQYSNSHGFPLRLVYAREARLLSQIEARFVSEFDATLVISDMEEKILRGVIGGASERLRVVPNGVDTGYFDPSLSFASPFSGGALPIVFTGAMDYHANVDGVRWFATAILPAIQRRNPAAVFVVVGSNPSAEVRALAARPGIVVTGRVADVRPYLGHAAVVVAPLRIARGVQNKVLEALAMARPVVATENAVQGIPGIAQASAAVTSDPVRFADAVAERLSGPSECSPSRAFVMDNFDWTRHLAGVASIFEARLDKLPRSASGTSTLD